MANNLGNKETMAKNIARFMREKGVNATEVCKTLGFPNATFSDWLNAKTYPRIDEIEKMALFFGVSKADLVEEPDYNLSSDDSADSPQVRMIARAGRKMSEADREKMLQLIKVAFPDKFDD